MSKQTKATLAGVSQDALEQVSGGRFGWPGWRGGWPGFYRGYGGVSPWYYYMMGRAMAPQSTYVYAGNPYAYSYAYNYGMPPDFYG